MTVVTEVCKRVGDQKHGRLTPRRHYPRPTVLDLRVVRIDHPYAIMLVEAVQQVYVHRYGGADRTPVAAGEFAPPSGLFLVGYADGEPAVCGGWRLRAPEPDPALREGDVELKRMYVVPVCRGRGYARRLLVELERTAGQAGGRRMVLETGTRQPEAMALYRGAGYPEMDRFGVYRHTASSRCFAKPLTPRARPRPQPPDRPQTGIGRVRRWLSTRSATENRISIPTRSCIPRRW